MNEFYTNKNDIESWLNEYKIKNYKLVPDEKYGYVVDVKGNVDLYKKTLSWIPVKFIHVGGDFICFDNKLTSLEYCPQIIGGDFWIENNQLISLDFCPQTVGGSFDCCNNQLISLEFCPQSVGGKFNCQKNPELGYLQKINDFSIIYQEHLKFKNKKDLAQKLTEELNESNKVVPKIKI